MDHMTSTLRMEMDRSHMTEKILNLTLEIICLLTGERCAVVKMAAIEGLLQGLYPPLSGEQSPITAPPPPSPTPVRNIEQKVLEVINQVIDLLSDESGGPADGNIVGQEEIKQEAEDNGGLDMWRFSEGHKELYKTEKQPLLIALDGSSKRNSSERHPRPLSSRASTHQKMQHHGQGEHRKDVKVEGKKTEETLGDPRSTEDIPIMVTVKEEEDPADIYTAPEVNIKETMEGQVTVSSVWTLEDGDSAQESSGGTTFTSNFHPSLPNAARPPDPSDPERGSSDTGKPYEAFQKEKRFPCSVCGRCFSSKSSLVSHVRTHTGERPFFCSECGKCFAHRFSLTAHKRYHTGEKLHACSECGKKFSLKGDLVRHMKSHTGEKPYSCPECGRGFAHTHQLTAHRRYHTGEKLLSCSECGKIFAIRGDLRRHMKSHTGEKPHSCSECGRGFTHKHQLTAHKRCHTGENPFTCAECGKSFSTRTNLNKHQRVHMGVNSS